MTVVFQAQQSMMNVKVEQSSVFPTPVVMRRVREYPVLCAAALSEECQGKTIQCFSNTCAFASCSGVPDATCHQSPCTCKAVFLLDGDDVTARCQSDGPAGLKGILSGGFKDLGLPLTTNVGNQPPKQADDCTSNSNCFFAPCLYKFCPAHPGAECRNDYCNGCKARYFVGNREVTDNCQDQIPSTGRSRLFGTAKSRLPKTSSTRWQPQANRFLSPWLSLFNAMFQ
ncbi:tissue factor pathway inhibitor 2 [Elysia marginata]|uniref:Tissue factor pathway inhibitor 2 n=1 Tax=Elysia marginata TaxID=1093978 RepID=A0AAV4EAN3_9GAST|nr:tissue factor pathway inhibitor 2 [Elysia marginata]